METEESRPEAPGAPATTTGESPADGVAHGGRGAGAGAGGGAARGRRRSRVGRAVVRVSQLYMLGYFAIVVVAVVADVLLRQQLDAPAQSAVTLLATASTALYFLALVLLLVGFSARLRLFRRRSAGLKLLYAGVAALLIARGYFSASVVLPELQRGPWPAIMADVGLLGATLIVLGLVVGVIDAVRFAFARAARVRLPGPRRD